MIAEEISPTEESVATIGPKRRIHTERASPWAVT
jgi:hypothetical protein